MSRSFDLESVDRITAGAVGEPGRRTFFVQARAGYDQITILAEKEQVRLLGEALEQMLAALPDALEDDPPGEADLALQEPLEPEWRAGSMSIEYLQEADRIAITINEIQPDADEEDDEAEPSGATARFLATRAQCRALAAHALEVVAAGRPRCQFCGEPMEPEGHMCPAMNGHRKPATD